MTHFTLNVSNHPDAIVLPVPQAAIDSWDTFYCGPIESRKVAKAMADALALHHKHVRLFTLTRSSGKMIYQV